MTDIDKAALLAEMLALSGVERQRPGDVTVKDFQTAADISYSLACRKLALLVVAGHYTEHEVLLDCGRRGKVYRPVRGAA